jgi:pSer/pThr/pTyr-binding forkhead associated (FHA) protein
MSDLRYLLTSPDAIEPFPVEGSVTVGRHLDNDLVVAGEDVRDFHVRIELAARGPRLTPIDGATVHVGALAVTDTTGLAPGDEIVLGQHRLVLDAAGEAPRGRFALHDVGNPTGIAIDGQLIVGRADECDLRILEGHISRRHALLRLGAGGVWLTDFDSANGTFVNGDRVRGSCRLFHGDEVAFDIVRFQLIGDAPDLTPIRPVGDEPDQLNTLGLAPVPDERSALDEVPTQQLEAPTPESPRSGPAHRLGIRGPALIGLGPPVAGRVLPLGFGRHTIGRTAPADLVIDEPSVSARHAEVEVKADGVYLVNLLSTNGTRVNGGAINTCRLVPGDEIEFGRVRMTFAAGRAAAGHRRWWPWAGAAALAATILFLFVSR